MISTARFVVVESRPFLNEEKEKRQVNNFLFNELFPKRVAHEKRKTKRSERNNNNEDLLLFCRIFVFEKFF